MKALHMDYGSLADDSLSAQVSTILRINLLYFTQLWVIFLAHPHLHHLRHAPSSPLLLLQATGPGLGPGPSSAPSMGGKAPTPMTPKSSGKHAPAFTETGVFAPGIHPTCPICLAIPGQLLAALNRRISSSDYSPLVPLLTSILFSSPYHSRGPQPRPGPGSTPRSPDKARGKLPVPQAKCL